jgi:hypothetical protein
MEPREPLGEWNQSSSNLEAAPKSENDDIIARLVNRIKELEQKLYGSHFMRHIWDAQGAGIRTVLSNTNFYCCVSYPV